MALSVENQYFLAVLSAFFNQTPAPVPPEMDVPAFVNLTTESRLRGIVGYMLQEYPFAQFEPKKDFLATLFHFTRKKEQMKAVRYLLKDAGIVHGALKGEYIAAHYPVPELRTYGDLDLLLDKKDLPRLRELMQDGFTVLHEDPDQLVAKKDDLLIEFHFSLLYDKGVDTPGLKAYLKNAMSHLCQGEDGLWYFDPLFHFVYILSHQMRHFRTSSPGIRSFLDLAVLVRAGWADAEQLPYVLQEIGLYEYGKIVLQLTEKWFGVPSPLPGKVTDEKAEQVAEYLLATGQFADGENPRARHLEQAAGKRYPKLYILFRSVFPTVTAMKQDNRYNRYWLPAAYVYRLFYGAFHRRKQIALTMQQLSTANEDAARRMRIHEIIGLEEPAQ